MICRLFFRGLQLLMLLLSVHWLFVSLLEPIFLHWAFYQGFSSLYLLLFPLVLGLIWFFKRSWLKSSYAFLVRHKVGVIVVAVIFQLLVLLSANLMIRSDAAVVFKGAFGQLPELSISSYLTRNPNNIPLFLYERFFYQIFGQMGLWVMQGINLLCLNGTAFILYQAGKQFFSQKVADVTFLLYMGLLGFSPYGMAMYTDILGLPFLAYQLYLSLAILKSDKPDSRQILLLGLVSGLAMIWRSTAVITIIALVILLLLKQAYVKMGKVLLLFTLSFGLVFGGLSLAVKQQTAVPLIEGEDLSKSALNFINLGLTYSGTDQEDMKQGLLQYLPKEERSRYNNGMFKKDYVIKEIKRRLSEYTPLTFMGHLLYKQTATVGDGTLGWIYRDPDKEKTAYVSPLYETWGRIPVLAAFRETVTNRYGVGNPAFALIKQMIWVLMALGLVFALLRETGQNSPRFLTLAIFGGLLFLLIFEGGKGRYLIQFMPQILLLSALGWETVARKGVIT